MAKWEYIPNKTFDKIKLYMFNEEIALNIDNPVRQLEIDIDGTTYRVTIELKKFYHPLYEQYYRILISSSLDQIKGKVIDWTLTQVYNAYELGLIEKVALRLMFSDYISNAILEKHKY